MILGTGIDIVHTERMKKWSEELCERWFHPEEIKAARSRGASMALSLAARFAAKEAFGKALGTGLRGIILKDIQVINSHNGRPYIILHKTAKIAFEQSGGTDIHLSLSHDEGNAIAMVIIEGRDV